MEERSLSAVREVVRGGKLDLTRDGQRLRLRLPMSRRDADGLTQFLRRFGSDLAELESNTPQGEATMRLTFLVRQALEASGAMTADDAGCSFSVDLLALLNELFTIARAEGAKLCATDPNAKTDARLMAKLARNWQGEAVMKGVDAEQLLRRFKNGK